MKNFILLILFVMASAISAFATPVANAGSDMTVLVGEAIRLDGSASRGYVNESQSDGTWSVRWQTGDGFDAENIIKCPHVYMTAGVYTATLTVKDASGAASTSSVRVTANEIPAAAPANTQTLIDTGNAETNRLQLQAAINAAAVNSSTSEIRVPAGFVFNDPLVLPARGSANDTNYVTIRVADLSALAANVRITNSTADKAKLFRMDTRGAWATGHNNGVELALGAHHYRIIGLEIRKTVSESNTDLVGSEFNIPAGWTINQHHFIMDRSLLDGNGFDTRKGASLNGQTMSLVNSSILNIKAPGVETKAVAQWVGAGPLGVINCRLEAASINSLVGGSPVGSSDDVLDGYVFRGNHVWKDPNWLGGGYGIKNLFELKHGFNTVAVGNVMENNYVDGQSGEAILIKSQTDEGCAYCEVSTVDFRSNKILNTRAGFNVINMQAFNSPYPKYANHIRFVNNFWEQQGGRGNLSQGADFFELIHNTFITRDSASSFMAYTSGSSGVPEDYKAPGYKLLNNIAYDDGAYGTPLRCDHANGTGALNDHLSSDWDVRKNVFGASREYIHPANNFYPASVKSEFVNYAGGNFNLKADSVYKNAATDGKDVGADIELLNSATASATSGVISTSPRDLAAGYEADVAPLLSGGDGRVTVADVAQIGLFVAGIAQPANSGEFQRADNAPRASKGDGSLTISDYIQAGRFAAGLDSLQTTGGPQAASVLQLTKEGKLTEESLASLSGENFFPSGQIGQEFLAAAGAVRVVNMTASGSTVLVSIETDSTGSENGFGFTLNYDSTKLGNPVVSLGAGVPTATLIPNTQNSGKVGVVIALPTGQTMQAGTKQLATILFDISVSASGTQTTLSFSDAPVVREAIDVNANTVPMTYTDGVVTILAPTAAPVAAGGQVTASDGRGIFRAKVSLTDLKGTTRFTVTNAFGYYRFSELAAGETYILGVSVKKSGFTQQTQVRTIVEDTYDINFTFDNLRVIKR